MNAVVDKVVKEREIFDGDRWKTGTSGEVEVLFGNNEAIRGLREEQCEDCEKSNTKIARE